MTVTYFAKVGQDTNYILQTGGLDFFGLRFKKIGNSHYYFCTQKIPSDAWFGYGINEFKRVSIAGINGLSKTSMEHIYDDAVIGPDASISPFIQAAQSVPRRQLREVTLNSKFMDEERKLLVYIPAAYKNTGRTTWLFNSMDKIFHEIQIMEKFSKGGCPRQQF